MGKFVEFVRILINWIVWLIRSTLRTPEPAVGPKRFENRWLTPLRSLSMLLLIMIPAWLWLSSLLQPVKVKTTSVLMPLCPTAQHVRLSQLYKYPSRYTHRKIWIAGQLTKGKTLCMKQRCEPGKTCCHPCTSALRLRHRQHRVRLKGLLKGKWLSCSGTTCKMNCSPLRLGGWLAFAGQLRVTNPPLRKRAKATSRIYEFRITHACRTTEEAVERKRVTIPDPGEISLRRRKYSRTTNKKQR